MGPLSWLLLVFCLLASPAHAQQAPQGLILPVYGPVHPGELVVLELALADSGGSPVDALPPVVELDQGRLVDGPTPSGPGRWRMHWQVPADLRPGSTVPVRVRTADLSLELGLSLSSPPRSELTVPAMLDARAAQRTPVRIPVHGADLPAPAELSVTVTQGQLVAVEPSEDGLVLSWQPPDDPLPRAVPMAIRDARQPGRTPAWTTVRLVGQPRIPIETDPGAQVLLELGGHRFGPYVANAQGLAVATPDVRPGESSAQVVVRDDLGNERRTTLSLGGVSQPTIVLDPEASIRPGQPLPTVHVGAFKVDGRPWSGPPPTCRTGVGEALVLAQATEGAWRATLPSGASRLFDVKVECVLAGQAQAVTRIPVDSQIPTDVRIRAWPPELSADLPAAQVQAWLEGPTGDRLPAAGLYLEAQHGTLELEPSNPALLVATFDGSAAVAHGGDRITAHWVPPPGTGSAWQLDAGLVTIAPSGQLLLLVQARDRQGRPVADVPLEVEIDGQQQQGTADLQGQLHTTLDTDTAFGPWVVTLRSGSVERRQVLFRTDAGSVSLPTWDLQASVDVPVRTGQVRRIIVEASPETIAAGGAESSRVMVRLQDQSGQAITDVPLTIEASVGKVGKVRVNADGSYEAEYRPPGRLAYGEVALSVSGGGDWSAHTRVQVAPRHLRYATALEAGWLYGSRALNSPWLSIQQDIQIPGIPAPLLARLGVGGYGLRSTVADDGTGQQVELSAAVIPLSISALLRHEDGRFAVWGGPGLVVAPYQLLAVYGNQVAVRGYGLTSPGAELVLGAGRRFGNGELSAQLSYLLLTMSPPDVGWEGPVGGVRASVGWRFLY